MVCRILPPLVFSLFELLSLLLLLVLLLLFAAAALFVWPRLPRFGAVLLGDPLPLLIILFRFAVPGFPKEDIFNTVTREPSAYCNRFAICCSTTAVHSLLLIFVDFMPPRKDTVSRSIVASS